jgi:phospholipid transport system transporter-binding protein
LQLSDAGPGRIALAGALDFANAAAALEQLRGRVRGGEPVVLDLAQVGRADSAGLAVLLALAGEASRRGQPLRLDSAPESLRALAQLCDVEGLLGWRQPAA